jgi:hypothetical protein
VENEDDYIWVAFPTEPRAFLLWLAKEMNIKVEDNEDPEDIIGFINVVTGAYFIDSDDDMISQEIH